MNAEDIQAEIEKRLRAAGLSSVLAPGRSQYLDFPDEIYVELVILDAQREQDILRILDGLLDGENHVDIQVHPIWKIEAIDAPELARSETGNIIAASIVPVLLRSGSETVRVRVAVTYLAEMELKRVTGREPDLRELARTYIESFLKRGGVSFWNPKLQGYLEISAERAVGLQQLLRKTA